MSKTGTEAFEKWLKREHPHVVLERANELQGAYMAGRREARNELRRSATAKKARELSQARRLAGMARDTPPARYDRLKAELDKLGFILGEWGADHIGLLPYVKVKRSHWPEWKRVDIDPRLIVEGSNMRQAAVFVSLELTKAE